MILRKISRPAPEPIALAHHAPRRGRCRPARPSTTIRAASRTDRSSRSRGPAALQRLDRLDHFERVADVAAERRVHRGEERLGPDAGRGCRPRPATRPARRAVSGVFMNAPRPALTSSTSASMPSAIFLLMIDAVMSGMLSTVPSRRAGRRASCRPGRSRRSGRSCRSRPRPASRWNSPSSRPTRKPGIDFELVERAAGVAEAAARHHRHDHAAGRGERRQDQRGLVADAAGAVLVDLQRRAGRDRSTLDAGVDHRLGQVGRLLRRSCRAGRSPSAGRRSGSRARRRR